MRATDAGGGGGTIVVDIDGVRRASTLVGQAGQALGLLGRRVASHSLPEMPPGVAGAVAGALAEVSGALGAMPHELIDVGQELRVRAFWAQVADRLTGGYDLSGAALTEFKAAYASGLLTRYAEPWQRDLAEAYAKKLHDDEHPGGFAGFVHGVGDFFTGAWDAIKDPAVMIYHLTPFSGGDWTTHWGQLGEGLAQGVTHPVQFAKAIVNLDALHERGFSYWLGNLAPAAAATLLSGGAAAAVRGADAAAAADRAAEGALAIERAGSAARMVDGSEALADAERGAVAAGRVDYSAHFADDLANFEGGRAWLHEGPLDRDLKLVQYYDKESTRASLKWWAPTDEANAAQTVEDVRQRLALLPAWGERDAVRVAHIPQGTHVDYLYGRAAPQTENGVVYAGGGEQLRFREFDPKWIRETRPLP
jgi:hypothetical protein